jgi:phospholipase C
MIGQGSRSRAADASLNDIGHIVILMQENRSFDYYFGHAVQRANRLMAMSAWIDPAGEVGDPIITTASDRLAMTGTRTAT